MKKLFDEIPRLENEHVTLRRVTEEDAEALWAMTRSREVYRYLPTFLFEQQYDDIHAVIRELYGDIFREKKSLILAVCRTEAPEIFCGLAEFYGFRRFMNKTCVGYRLAEQFWGQGIAAQTVELMVDYLFTQTDTRIITASTMIENHASARVLEKNGFLRILSGVPEDWGYPKPVKADKWIRGDRPERENWRFHTGALRSGGRIH